jgi:hypothetical protein
METWAAYADGVYDVTISRWDPESSPGRYYIGVYADCANTNTAATYTIKATSDDTNDNTDILLTPTLAQNFGLTADGYKYFRFCVPNDDKDVNVELINCYMSTAGVYTGLGNCNVNTYTMPELIVTRNIIKPTIADLGYKLATTAIRDVNILASDQAGNNPYGYHSGVYYVAVHGWCTPDPYCSDPSWMGCCTNYANTPPMEVKVTLTSGIIFIHVFPITHLFVFKFILTYDWRGALDIINIKKYVVDNLYDNIKSSLISFTKLTLYDS